VLGHPMTSPRYVREVLLPAVRRGAIAAGRTPDDVNVSTGVILQMSHDREQARLEAAGQVGFYATTRTYRPVLALHGHQDRIEALRDALGVGDLPRLAREALPMVDDLAIAGTPEECVEKVRAFEGVVDRLLLGGAWVGPDRARLIENHSWIVETFAPARS
jgi:alkanesulfonate monooxygenase SsuD/methylene tetrahydromethanopterin reductase-like flavin-dependent oxidoreductase (luciferase family)